MRPHGPARLFLLMLVAAPFAALIGFALENPWLAFGAYAVALLALLLLAGRRHAQVVPREPL